MSARTNGLEATDMPGDVRAAIGQIEVVPLELERNVETMVTTVREAATELDANVVLLPELANIGYIRDRERDFGEAYLGAAEPIPGPTTDALVEVAAEHGVYVVAGIAERHPVLPSTIFNSAALVGPQGVVGVHRKVHMPGQEKHYFARGDAIDVFPTPFGSIGISICYDTFFPEQQRLQALKGAHMILCPFNTAERFDHPDVLPHIAAARAMENKLFVATCNRTGSEGDLRFNGLSAAADPYGATLVALGEEPAIGLAVFEASLFRKERAYQPIYADRRPELYGALSEPLL